MQAAVLRQLTALLCACLIFVTPTMVGCNLCEILPVFPDCAGGGLQVARVLDPDNEIAAVAVADDGETLVVLAEKDPNGNALRVTGATNIAIDGSAVTVYAGANGLPSFLVSNGWVLSFTAYSGDTAVMTARGPDGTTTEHGIVSFDSESIRQLRNSGAAGDVGAPAKVRALQKGAATAQAKSPLDLFTTFKGGKLLLSAVLCGGSIATAVGSAGIAIPLAVLSCTSTALKTYSFLTGDEATEANTALTIVTCAAELGSPDLPLSCAELLVDAAAFVQEHDITLSEGTGSFADGEMIGLDGRDIRGSIDLEPNFGLRGTPVVITLIFVSGGGLVAAIEEYEATQATGGAFVRNPIADLTEEGPSTWRSSQELGFTGVRGIIRYVALDSAGQEIAAGDVLVAGGLE